MVFFSPSLSLSLCFFSFFFFPEHYDVYNNESPTKTARDET